jgi:hypothetical protein
MAGFAAYGRKMFSIALIFNSLVCISYAIGLLAGFYLENWVLYFPFVINGNLFWLIIVASVVNIFPAAHIGKVKTGRLWFHHYVYGFFVWFASAALLLMFTSVSLFSLVTGNITDIGINAGRFFILGGVALVLDDLPDVSNVTASALNWLKSKAYQGRQLVHSVQFLMGCISVYFSVSVGAWITLNPEGVTVANLIFVGTLAINGLISFMSVKRKIWLRINPETSIYSRWKKARKPEHS